MEHSGEGVLTGEFQKLLRGRALLRRSLTCYCAVDHDRYEGICVATGQKAYQESFLRIR